MPTACAYGHKGTGTIAAQASRSPSFLRRRGDRRAYLSWPTTSPAQPRAESFSRLKCAAAVLDGPDQIALFQKTGGVGSGKPAALMRDDQSAERCHCEHEGVDLCCREAKDGPEDCSDRAGNRLCRAVADRAGDDIDKS